MARKRNRRPARLIDTFASKVCPHCGDPHVAVRVITWVDFSHGEVSEDQEATDLLEDVFPFVGAPCVCKQCGHHWELEA